MGRFCIPNTTLYSAIADNNCTNNPNANRSANDPNSTNNANCTNYTLVNSQLNITSFFTNQYVSTDKLFAWLGDLLTTKNILFASIGFAFVITIIYLCLIRLIGGVLVYLTILFVLVGFIALGYLFQMRINYYTAVQDAQYQQAMLGLSITFYCLAGIWLLYIMFMCNSIRLALALLNVIN